MTLDPRRIATLGIGFAPLDMALLGIWPANASENTGTGGTDQELQASAGAGTVQAGGVPNGSVLWEPLIKWRPIKPEPEKQEAWGQGGTEQAPQVSAGSGAVQAVVGGAGASTQRKQGSMAVGDVTDLEIEAFAVMLMAS